MSYHKESKTHLLETENRTKCGLPAGPCSVTELALDTSELTCARCKDRGNTAEHMRLMNIKLKQKRLK